MANPRPLTREELAKFLPDQRSIRAFEQLFAIIPSDIIVLTKLIEEVGIEAVSAMARAESNSESLSRIAEALELLTSVPVKPESNHQVVDSIDVNQYAPVNYERGRMWWNDFDDTLNIGHKNGVIQQVGQETYMHVENGTGSLIPNGTIIGFAGVNGYIKCSPYVANGTIPVDYYIGVVTQDLAAGQVGMATLYGQVRGIDTTGSSVGETWAKGDILYASPTIPGSFTNIRPTAPSSVITVAAVLSVSSTDGRIMVRATVPTGFAYATYYSTVSQALAAANTPYLVTYNASGAVHDISLVSGTSIKVAQAGLYTINVKLQVTSSNASSSKVYAWLAKNGSDVPGSRNDFTIKSNGDTKLMSYTNQLSLLKDDYIDIKWAGDTTSLFLDAIAATGFAPAASSARVFITQTQL